MTLFQHYSIFATLVSPLSSASKGFASIEAKRNFKAPRISPKHPGAQDDSVSCPEEHKTNEAAGQLSSSNDSLDVPRDNALSSKVLVIDV